MSKRLGQRGLTYAEKQPIAPPGLKPKDLVGVPWMLAFALRADGWWLRQEIIWAKKACMPESVEDRCTRSHEQVFMLTKRERYFYDGFAIREGNTEGTLARHAGEPETPHRHAVSSGLHGAADGDRHRGTLAVNGGHAAGRNKRSVWPLGPEPYPEAHFATFPTKLVEPMILAGTSQKGCCPACGNPWERVVEREPGAAPLRSHGTHPGPKHLQGPASRLNSGTAEQWWANRGADVTTGWRPTCAHSIEPIPCTILDPFAGSGTVGRVAEDLGRHSILIEQNPDYVKLAEKRTAQQGLFAQGAA